MMKVGLSLQVQSLDVFIGKVIKRLTSKNLKNTEHAISKEIITIGDACSELVEDAW